MARRPNIVLVTSDQLRPFALGCYGDPVARTPNLDRILREGVRFEHAISNAPVCMAARSVLLSGQYNRSCTGGVTNVSFPGRPGDFLMPEYPFPGRPHLPAPTLAEVLRAEGYDTAVIGKWHIHSWPQDVGFDHYLIPRVHHCHSGQSYTRDGGPELVPFGYSVDFEAAEVAAYLSRRALDGTPFFLYYNISPPHCPLADAPDRYLRMFDPEAIPLRPNVTRTRGLDSEDYWYRVYRWDFRYYNLQLPHTQSLPPGYDLRSLIAEYYGLTAWVDDAVGSLLAALDRTGQAEDTILLFTSDHGDCLGSHGLWQKGNSMEESIRVPWLLRYPSGGLARLPVRDQVASLVDVAPTLLSLAGLNVPAHFQGQDLADVARGGRAHTERPWAVAELGGWRCVRTPAVVATVGGRGGPSWYDLAGDPYQLAPLPGPIDAGLERILERYDRETPWLSTT